MFPAFYIHRCKVGPQRLHISAEAKTGCCFLRLTHRGLPAQNRQEQP